MNTNETKVSEAPSFEIVKAVKVNDFERKMVKDRYTNLLSPAYGFATKVSVKIKNVVREIELTFEEDWRTEGKPWRAVIDERQKKEIDDQAADFGVAIDWRDVLTEYTGYATELRAQDQAKASAAREKTWDAFWGHSFIKDLKAALPEAEAKVTPCRENYVKDVDRYTGVLDVHIDYKGFGVSVSKVDGAYRLYTIDYKRYRATKITTLAAKIKSDVEARLDRDKRRTDAEKKSEDDFARVKELFPDFTIEKTYPEGRYRLALPGSYNRIEFRFSYSPTSNREAFGFNGVDQGLSLADFSKVVGIFKAAAEAALARNAK